jgi:hypothetical protein
MARTLNAKQRAALDAELERTRAAIPTTRCPACGVGMPVRDLARHLVERCPGEPGAAAA